MMRKTAILAIIIVLFACLSAVYADDSLDNSTLETADEEVISIENDEVLEDSSEITIDDSNYDQYFNRYTGKFKDDVGSVSTVRIGNVSNKLFTFDRPVNVLPASDDSQIRNGVIHLIAGSELKQHPDFRKHNLHCRGGGLLCDADGLFLQQPHSLQQHDHIHHMLYGYGIMPQQHHIL